MKDLTQGSIVGHISAMAPQIFAGMIMMMLCGLIDLYFVSGLGDAAIAGVGAAGNAGFLINALTQVLSVGTVALIAHAAGRKDRADANLVFNQSLGLSAVGGILTLIAGSLLARGYMRSVAADGAVIEAGTTYLLWFMPALALQFAMLVMASALRGTGIVRPTMIVQAVTVIINILLAPVLIAGWGTGRALGVAGAGLASSIAVVIGVVMMWIYFHRSEHYVAIDRALWRPQIKQWKRINALPLLDLRTPQCAIDRDVVFRPVEIDPHHHHPDHDRDRAREAGAGDAQSPARAPACNEDRRQKYIDDHGDGLNDHGGPHDT